MPTICHFRGIMIRMYRDDHGPPHFHVWHESGKAAFSIETGEMIAGRLHGRIASLVRTWAALRRPELLENWALCRKQLDPKPIAPIK